MKRVSNMVLIFLSITGIIACQNMSNAQGIKKNMDVDQFEKQLASTPNAQLIDVRTPEEYADGHLQNAVNIDYYGSGFRDEISRLDKNKPVFVYCLSGGRSGKAAGILQDMGFKEVYNMKGGYLNWSNAGKGVEKGNVARPPGTVLDANTLKELEHKTAYVLVDYQAKWCEPCRKMAPMLDAFVSARKDSVSMIKVDADANQELMKQNGINGIPHIELYHNGEKTWSHEGYIEQAELQKATGL